MLPERTKFLLPGGVGFCNAVRRTLLEDVHSWAPARVTVHCNTTCQTDEFLAHRIGLIPFRPAGTLDPNADPDQLLPLRVDLTGPRTVVAGDLSSGTFEPVHPNLPVMLLGPDHRLCLSVHMDRQPAKKHARYAPCAAVGMQRADETHHELQFSTVDGRQPKSLLLEALDHLEARVDRALQQLAHPPAHPPKSFC